MKRLWAKLKMRWFRRRNPKAEEFSDSAKLVFASANQAATDSDAQFIGSAHILLGLLRRTDLLGKRREQLETRAVSDLSAAAENEASDIAKRVIEASIEEARAVGTQEIDPQLILAGLCRLTDSAAAQLLAEIGVTLDDARKLPRAT